MNTPLEFYKKLLAYDDELDLDKPSPLTHKGVIHLMTEYSSQLHKLSVGGPASASALDGEQLPAEGQAQNGRDDNWNCKECGYSWYNCVCSHD